MASKNSQCSNCQHYTLKSCRGTAITNTIILIFSGFFVCGLMLLFFPLALIVLVPIYIVFALVLFLSAFAYRKDDVTCTHCKYTTFTPRKKK